MIIPIQNYNTTYEEFTLKVQAFNKTDFTQFLDTDGNNDPHSIVTIPPKQKILLDIPSETRFVELAKEKQKTIVMRKV